MTTPQPNPSSSTRPPLRKPPGPEPKPLARPAYEAPTTIRHIKRTYTRQRKIDVLLFLENHRIPLRPDRSDLRGAKVVGDSPVEEGFRRPFLREAAAHFGIKSWGTVQTWWAKRHQIWLGHRRRPLERRPRWPDLEARLYSEFCTARKDRRLVQRTWFRRRSIAIFEELYPGDVFVFSNGWFRGFLKRHQITHRRITHASTRVPEETVNHVNEFLQFIRRNSRVEAWRGVTLMSDPVEGLSLQRFPPHLIINLDETPMPFEFLDGFTYDHKGTNSVQGRSQRSGWSKRQATLVLALVADGSQVDLLKPVVIFHGKGTVMARECDLYHPGVDVKFNDTAYNNETLLEDWIRTKLAVYTEGRDSLFVMDVARFHKTTKIQEVLDEHNITTALIPPGLTGYLQPLDVGFNGPFKKWLRDEMDLYLDRLDLLGSTPEKWTVRDRRIMTTHVVARAWERSFSDDNKSMVANLFKKTGISVHPDGREDHLISIKGIDADQLKISADDWYLPPDRRTNCDTSDALPTPDAANEGSVPTAEALGLPPNNYSTLTNRVLKDMCRQRGLRVSGPKRQLIGRLEDHDAATAMAARQARQEGHREEITQSVAGDQGNEVVQRPADAVYAPIGPRARGTSLRAFELEADDEDTPNVLVSDETAGEEVIRTER